MWAVARAGGGGEGGGGGGCGEGEGGGGGARVVVLGQQNKKEPLLTPTQVGRRISRMKCYDIDTIAIIRCYNDLRGQTLRYAFGNKTAPKTIHNKARAMLGPPPKPRHDGIPLQEHSKTIPGLAGPRSRTPQRSPQNLFKTAQIPSTILRPLQELEPNRDHSSRFPRPFQDHFHN